MWVYMFSGRRVRYMYDPTTVCEHITVLRTGQATGPIFAACLRVLVGLVGTPLFPDLKGHILALEDIDERPYRIDRDLNQLFLSGALIGIVGIVFGSFSTCTDPDGRDAAEVFATWADKLRVRRLRFDQTSYSPL
jgi:muramoyltetrapeptide carboxypeptidase LdcA involved in peptidoglycan recycling